MEEERVEAGAELAAFGGVPDERVAVVAEVAGEGLEVPGGVAESQDVVLHEFAGGGVAEGAVEVVGGDHRELFDDVPGSCSRPGACTFAT